MQVKRFTEQEFFSLCEEWTRLHASGVHQRLFTSWHWMSAWWLTFKQNQFELLLLGAYDEGKLVGVAPLYIQKISFRGLPIKRVQFIGSNNSGSAGFRAEYLQFVCLAEQESKACGVLADFLLNKYKVSDLLLNDVCVGSATEKALVDATRTQRCYLRETARDRTYYVNTHQNFQAYLSDLGANTRRRVFNGRARLASGFDLEVQGLNWNDLKRTLDEVKAFYKHRWSSQLNFEELLAFLTRIEELAGSNGLEANKVFLDGSRIVLNGNVKALSLNLAYNDTIYNFMLGFDANFAEKVSLGMLTLGHDIERACAHDTIEQFDLMAGTGKQENYKEKMAVEGLSLRSMQIVCAPWLKGLYSIYDRFFQK